MTTPEIDGEAARAREAARVVARKSPQRIARVVAAADVADGTRHLTLEMIDPAALGFAGGQYVIVDTGLTLPSGKAVKRAYSILSADHQQGRIELGSLRLPDGPGSGFMHALQAGAEVRFSGPWGKLHLGGGGLAAQDGAPPATLALATDTGVTAILGLVRSRWFAPVAGGCTFVWLRPTVDYFLPAAFVGERLPPGLAAVHIGALPPAGDPERLTIARHWLREAGAGGRLERVFIAGDGAVNYALLDDLMAAGIPASRDSVESFFNMPKKSTGEGSGS